MYYSLAIVFLGVTITLAFYLVLNDRAYKRHAPELLKVSPERATSESTRTLAVRLQRNPIAIEDHLPALTGRRYIVVGGSGFLGAWIVVHLIVRGENPKNIRIVDVRPPTRPDLTVGGPHGVEFVQVDITDFAAVESAFLQPWLENTEVPLTVIHTAANIRFYERHLSNYHLSTNVNVVGTQNVVDACISSNASVLVCTSSASIGVHNQRLWLWPWESRPPRFIQILRDGESLHPKQLSGFFSNYAGSKLEAERLVCKAHGSTTARGGTLKTGCIRPGNGVFGAGGGEYMSGLHLASSQSHTRSWMHTLFQAHTYVENCSLAHLLYEQRLIEGISGLGGQSFVVCDPGPLPTYGDTYTAVTTLTNGARTFGQLPPSPLLLLSYFVEAYHRSRQYLAWNFGITLPPLSPDIQSLQPSTFRLTLVNLVCDDSRARLSSEKGGLGYKGAFTTLEGVCETVRLHPIVTGQAGSSSSS